MKRKKVLIILTLSIFIIGYGTKNYLLHKNCYNQDHNLYSKTAESDQLRLSLGIHFTKAFHTDSPKDLLNSLNNLFKCQLKIASKLEKTTTDLQLKELLNIYIKELRLTLSTHKDISNITYEHINELRLKVLKTFDISLYKALIEIDKIYSITVHDDFISYIKYLIYTYEQSPNTYNTFTPDLKSYYYFDTNLYP